MMSSEYPSPSNFRISASLPPTVENLPPNCDYLMAKFRAITTTIQLFQQTKLPIVIPQPTTIRLNDIAEDYDDAGSDREPESRPDRRLRTLNALTTLLVRDHEVVAVVMGLLSAGRGSSSLELLASESSSDEVELVATANPRRGVTHHTTDSSSLEAMLYSGTPSPALLIPNKRQVDVTNPLPFVLNHW